MFSMSFSICDTTNVEEVCRKRTAHISLLDYANENRHLGSFNDVEICTGSDCFPANRMVLSCFSTYFEKMFKVEMKEKYQSSVEIKGINGNCMKDLIEFIYTGNVKINSENVCNLLSAADYLQVHELKEFCFDFLKTAITTENCFVMICIAECYQSVALKNCAEHIISDNFDAASTTKGFKNLSEDDLINCILKQDRSRVSEKSMYNALIGWTKHDEKNHALAFPQIFEHIDIGKFSHKFLEDVVMKEELVLQNAELCRKLIHELNKRLKSSENRQSISQQRILSLGATHIYSKVIEVINCSKESPKTYPDLPVKREYSCSVMLHNHLYNVGGNVFRTKSENNTTRSIWRLNIRDMNLEWEKVNSLNKSRSFVGAASFNESLVVAGGVIAGSCSCATVEAFFPSLNQWKMICPMLLARSGHALVTCNDCLYAIGGDGSCFKPLSSVECLVGIDDEWKFVQQMHMPRLWFAAVNCNGFVYAIGGQSGEDENKTLKSVERYDPINNEWSFVESMNFYRNSFSACVLQGRIVVAGGLDRNGDVVKAIESYDPLFDKWTIVGETEEELSDHSLVVV